MRSTLSLLLVALLAMAGAATAINNEDEPSRVRQLSADEIRELTVNKTWVIDYDLANHSSTTFYKAGGERFTQRDGRIERMEWFIRDDLDRRCVRSSFGEVCGAIAKVGPIVKICMAQDGLGDCAYTVVRIEDGDFYDLENRAPLPGEEAS